MFLLLYGNFMYIWVYFIYLRNDCGICVSVLLLSIGLVLVPVGELIIVKMNILNIIEM